jgi:hypothetical protein
MPRLFLPRNVEDANGRTAPPRRPRSKRGAKAPAVEPGASPDKPRATATAADQTLSAAARSAVEAVIAGAAASLGDDGDDWAAVPRQLRAQRLNGRDDLEGGTPAAPGGGPSQLSQLCVSHMHLRIGLCRLRCTYVTPVLVTKLTMETRNRPILTEIYLCHAYSGHEILRTETAGQADASAGAAAARADHFEGEGTLACVCGGAAAGGYQAVAAEGAAG